MPASPTFDPQICERFEQLIHVGSAVLATKTVASSGSYVDGVKSEAWGMSCISFIGRVLGKDSEHYQRFDHHYSRISSFSSAARAAAVLAAAYEDYRGGYLFNTIKRIRAEMFDNFLEQAEHMLADGYFGVSAVIAGAVLEDTLRKMCVKAGMTLSAAPKLETMNADLARAGVYDKLIQKKVTWLADLRNKAAHGKWDDFGPADVEDMLRATRRFVEEYV